MVGEPVRGAASTPGSAVLITGAAGGIGRALAWRWAREDARLALVDVDVSGVEALSAELTAAGHEALALPCDVTDEAACREAVGRAVERFGTVNVVVANAGMTHLSPVAETDVSVFRRVMDVNFFGAVNVVLAALPEVRRRRGRIVVLSSVAGFAPLSGRSGYAASKHALHGFFGSLRGELAGEGVSVTLVCPSFVRTRIGDGALGGDGGPATRPRTETGTPMEPEAVADALVRAALRRRSLLVLGSVGRTAWWLWRLAPWLYERLMVRRLLREQIRAAR
ncbi:MAG: hypothetical protein AMXMBFR53_22510 [Gemmatimonadota bacterium]